MRYKHIKTGATYTFISRIGVKFPLIGWVFFIKYFKGNEQAFYIRTEKSFNKKFKKIE